MFGHLCATADLAPLVQEVHTIRMGWRSHLGTTVKEGLRPVVDLVYPPRCPLCGGSIAVQGGLCGECWGALEVPGEPACSTCQRPMGAGAANKFEHCLHCSAQAPLHSGVIAATLYNDASRKLILSYKHGSKIALAPLLAQLLAARIPDWDRQPPLLIPVPLHRWRIWQRGFNQAAMLAREIAKRGKGELLVDGLVRTKRTPSLGGLGQEERKRALTGAIGVRSRAARRIAGRDVILVDDVLTSGATSDACVQVLLNAGASSVRIACFARVVDGRGMGGFAKQTSGLENGTLKENRAPKNETPEVVKTPGAT